jgi:hypothetical protein
VSSADATGKTSEKENKDKKYRIQRRQEKPQRIHRWSKGLLSCVEATAESVIQ